MFAKVVFHVNVAYDTRIAVVLEKVKNILIKKILKKCFVTASLTLDIKYCSISIPSPLI